MAKIKSVTVQAGQTIWDIAVQEYNTPEGSILLLQANPDISLATVLVPGTELVIWAPEAVKALTEILKVDPYASSIQSMLIEWATLVMRPAAEGGTTTELNPGFGIHINDFIASLNLDDLHASEAVELTDTIIFIHPSETGNLRYRKAPLSSILQLISVTTYLKTCADVDVIDAQDNDLLKYNDTTKLWENDPILGLGALEAPADDRIMYFNSTTGVTAWLTVGDNLSIVDGVLHVALPEAIWTRNGTIITPKTSKDTLAMMSMVIGSESAAPTSGLDIKASIAKPTYILNPGAGGGSINLTEAHHTVIYRGAVNAGTVNLPSCRDILGREYLIENSGTLNLTINTTNDEQILSPTFSAYATYPLAPQKWLLLRAAADGAVKSWYVAAHNL